MAKITIELDTNAGDTLSAALQALIVNQTAPVRGVYKASIPVEATETYKQPSVGDTGPTREKIVAAGEAMVEETAPADKQVWVNNPDAPLGPYDGERKRGTALNGGRRTKAQIAEDTLYFDQERNREADKARDSSGVKTQTFKTAEAAVAAMEAGVEPADLKQEREEDGNVADAEDEVSEAAESAEPTLETLRAAYVRYSNKFGVPAAIKDIKVILGCGVAEVPKDKVPEALAKIEAAMAAENIDAYLATLREPEKAPTATKAQLMAAIMGYGKKYDGTEKPDDMTLTKQDLPVIFTELFGVGVTGLGSMKEQTPEAFGALLAAIKGATDKNRFGRKVVGK